MSRKFAVLPLMLLCALTAFPLRAEDSAQKTAAVKKFAVQFTLEGMIPERAAEDDLFQAFGGDGKMTSVGEWISRIEKAAQNDKVGGVLLVLEQPMLSWTHAQALKQALLALKKAGKPVVAYADDYQLIHYTLAANADKVFINPNGHVMLQGIKATQLYLKGTLDKLGLQADMYHVGAFKGAAEPLMLNQPSKEVQEMMNWLLDDIYAQLCEQIGQARGKDAAAGKAWMEGGPYTGSQALKAGLIDGMKTRVEAAAELKKLAGVGEAEKLERHFGEKKLAKKDFSSPFAFLTLFAELAGGAKQQAPANKPVIGVIYAQGSIHSGRGDDDTIGTLSTIAAIEKARKDSAIKAVVLRVDSPGGSALASEDIYQALLKLKAEKPLIASVGYMAASGGYYIVAPCQRIFAAPNSLVGSIGVVGGKIVTKGLLDWAGMSTFSYTRGGERAGMFDMTTPFNEAEKQWFKGSMNEVYEKFVSRVKEGRGDKLKDFEAKITGGKIFTGRQGIQNGLVDELGTLKDTIAYTAGQLNLKENEYEVRPVNRIQNFAEKFFKGLSGKEDDDDASASASDAGRVTALLSGQQRGWLTLLKTMDPLQAQMIGRQIGFLDLLEREHVLAVMPFELLLK